MLSPTARLVLSGILLSGLCAVLAGACYDTPPLDGYYRCADDTECGDGGLVCDDGVCCAEQGEPLCVGRVLDGGVCADGGTAIRFYRDVDEDGFGNLTEPLLRCAVPTTFPVATNPDDCNDNPARGGAVFFPGAPEQCDGEDNDCDGELDEGLDGGTWYRDQDQDGFGDPDQRGTFCQGPSGWVANPNDCGPGNPRVFPDAGEVCNAVDDNCNGATDDIAEEGQPCTVPNRLGLCAQGGRTCSAGQDACKQTVFPTADVCDGRDNNCDGFADDKPDCGGPSTLATDRSVVFGAKYLQASLNGAPRDCVKDNPGSTPLDMVSRPDSNTVRWIGSGFGSHVFWAERDGGTWDLSRPGASLKLAVNFRSDGGASGTPPNRWSDHNQPVVLLCGPGGFLRLVHPGRLLQGTQNQNFTRNVPMPAPDGGRYNPDPNAEYWVVGQYSSPDIPAVLRQVKRVEVLIQLEAVSPPPSFQADYTVDFGFP